MKRRRQDYAPRPARRYHVNAPGQIVIGGPIQAVEAAMERSKEFGARRALRLNVSGAFHTSLMGPAVEGMTRALAEASICDPMAPIVANVSGASGTSVSALREELVSQLTHSVQWQRSVELMATEGVGLFMEFGPGEVLTGLVRRVVPDSGVCNLNSIASLDSRG
jgi:[acyl-carrier-protein] S-malonyltransferase